jgi:hypothetical protein
MGRLDPRITKPPLSCSTPPRWHWRRRGSRGPRPVPGEQRRPRRRSTPSDGAGAGARRSEVCRRRCSEAGREPPSRSARMRWRVGVEAGGGGRRRGVRGGAPRLRVTEKRGSESGEEARRATGREQSAAARGERVGGGVRLREEGWPAGLLLGLWPFSSPGLTRPLAILRAGPRAWGKAQARPAPSGRAWAGPKNGPHAGLMGSGYMPVYNGRNNVSRMVKTS